MLRRSIEKYGSLNYINCANGGGERSNLDAFYIATNTFNPYKSFTSLVGFNLINSMVDYNPFVEKGSLSTLGNGKNVFQVGFDFSFGFFGEGLKYTLGTLGGSSGMAEVYTDVVTGNVGSIVQEMAADK